ncbi:MAG: hypothetical protein UT30_C0044G0001 [Candidatus Uhrbacteria bacterium GW2011_GWF2_39_13]|uniref:Calcium-binding protein n=1 Tax=Candidatus Uhrbacteria bacterium GW2011_GWF2_39_13 TaxID=1618995 RepID=A0A0G0PXP9_9BACT|nr:MAG: hypothetical protein UT30_C0044G0001 [Candidatus Uhrbacteria bacterium GW2011_GWF2_39_13]
MRILFVIPHFFNHQGTGNYGSTDKSAKQVRLNALIANLTVLYQLFGNSTYNLDIANRKARKINDIQNNITVVFCTYKSYHLLDHIPTPEKCLNYNIDDAAFDPMMLGFQCRRVLMDNFGKYDYYCYLEDDLIINDPWFFRKLEYYNNKNIYKSLLLPNRYESSLSSPVNKLYVDGNLRSDVTSKYQDVNENNELSLEIMGETFRFQKTLNPHSGCYFLNAAQIEYWAQQPEFLDVDTSFIGPLESAVTQGIMKTFDVYKPSDENADFLEIQHYGTRFLSLVGKTVTLSL